MVYHFNFRLIRILLVCHLNVIQTQYYDYGYSSTGWQPVYYAYQNPLSSLFPNVNVNSQQVPNNQAIEGIKPPPKDEPKVETNTQEVVVTDNRLESLTVAEEHTTEERKEDVDDTEAEEEDTTIQLVDTSTTSIEVEEEVTEITTTPVTSTVTPTQTTITTTTVRTTPRIRSTTARTIPKTSKALFSPRQAPTTTAVVPLQDNTTTYGPPNNTGYGYQPHYGFGYGNSGYSFYGQFPSFYGNTGYGPIPNSTYSPPPSYGPPNTTYGLPTYQPYGPLKQDIHAYHFHSHGPTFVNQFPFKYNKYYTVVPTYNPPILPTYGTPTIYPPYNPKPTYGFPSYSPPTYTPIYSPPTYLPPGNSTDNSTNYYPTSYGSKYNYSGNGYIPPYQKPYQSYQSSYNNYNSLYNKPYYGDFYKKLFGSSFGGQSFNFAPNLNI